MGFLKKGNAPSELPDLAIDSLRESEPKKEIATIVHPPLPTAEPLAQHSVPAQPEKVPEVKETSVAGEDYLEVSHNEALKNPVHERIKNVIGENADGDDELSKSSFFDNVLEDINGGIADVGKLEDWYEKKFVKEDVVSNMKGYWEGNKADIIIKSFGAEYKRQITDKVKILQELEEDWREIYFRLVKKEEEMKKEERELKETVSEFVNLCKRRNECGEEKKKEGKDSKEKE